MKASTNSHKFSGRVLCGVLTAALIPAIVAGCGPAAAVGDEATPAKAASMPPYPVKQPAAGQQVATFAGGCFWSLDAMFQKLKGVSSVEPGFGGGKVKNPSYEQVCTATTGHAEAVNIVFDPKAISYRELADIFLNVHNPTTLNRQGADEGPQYRSAIFYRDAAQKKDAEAAIKDATAKRLWQDPIVTRIEPFTNFYRAEDYHLDYFNRNPNQGYSANVVAPKVEKFEEKYKDKLKK